MIVPGSDRFPDLTAKDIAAVRRLTRHLMDAPDLMVLGRELIAGSGGVLPADFMLFNLWTLPMDAMVACQANDQQRREELERRNEALSATIHHHPAIAAGQLAAAHLRPQRMSDYQSDLAFRSNPLFSEVYRHLDLRYQVAFIAARLDDSQVVLSWNMGGRDFTDREVQLQHLLGAQVGMLSRSIAERRAFESAWDAITSGLAKIGGPANGLATSPPVLGKADGRILSALIRGDSRAKIAGDLQWRRDTLDKHLGALRERLGYENAFQMMRDFSAMRALKKSEDPGE